MAQDLVHLNGRAVRADDPGRRGAAAHAQVSFPQLVARAEQVVAEAVAMTAAVARSVAQLRRTSEMSRSFRAGNARVPEEDQR
jgi:hypothetical protein